MPTEQKSPDRLAQESWSALSCIECDGPVQWNCPACEISQGFTAYDECAAVLMELVAAQEARLVAAARSGLGETGGLTNTIDRLDAAWAAARALRDRLKGEKP